MKLGTTRAANGWLLGAPPTLLSSNICITSPFWDPILNKPAGRMEDCPALMLCTAYWERITQSWPECPMQSRNLQGLWRLLGCSYAVGPPRLCSQCFSSRFATESGRYVWSWEKIGESGGYGVQLGNNTRGSGCGQRCQCNSNRLGKNPI